MSQQTKILLLDRFESDARYNCGGSLKAVFHRNSNLFLYGAAISMQGIGANAFSLSLLYKVASLKIEREKQYARLAHTRQISGRKVALGRQLRTHGRVIVSIVSFHGLVTAWT